MNIQKLQLNATLARILLSLALVLILLVMTAGFYMAYNFMKDSAQQVASVQADAKAADKKLQDVRSKRQRKLLLNLPATSIKTRSSTI